MGLLNTQQKIALARLAHGGIGLVRRLLGMRMKGLFKRGGVEWELDLGEGIDFSIFLLGSFEPETVRYYQQRLKPGQVALDIGANIGAHTLPLAQCVGAEGKVHAFEPTEYAFGKLKANLARNPTLAARVEARQMLLTEPGLAEVPTSICSSWPLESGSDLHPEHGGRLQSTAGAKSSTLDEALTGMGQVDFIKLDVDGVGLSVLRGGECLLRRLQPPIRSELCPHVCREHGYEFRLLVECLTDLGYHFETLSGRHLPSAADALERLIPAAGSLNAMAIARC